MYDFPTHLYQLTGVGLLELCLNQWFYPGPEVLDHASGTINVLRIFDSLSESNSSEPELETGNEQCILAPWLSMTHVHVESCSGSFVDLFPNRRSCSNDSTARTSHENFVGQILSRFFSMSQVFQVARQDCLE